MQSDPGLKLEIRGFTDQKGSREYNAKLSEDRAKAVKEFLVENGMDPARISILPMGMSTDDNLTEEEMRRVEFRLVE